MLIAYCTTPFWILSCSQNWEACENPFLFNIDFFHEINPPAFSCSLQSFEVNVSQRGGSCFSTEPRNASRFFHVARCTGNTCRTGKTANRLGSSMAGQRRKAFVPDIVQTNIRIVKRTFDADKTRWEKWSINGAFCLVFLEHHWHNAENTVLTFVFRERVTVSDAQTSALRDHSKSTKWQCSTRRSLLSCYKTQKEILGHWRLPHYRLTYTEEGLQISCWNIMDNKQLDLVESNSSW